MASTVTRDRLVCNSSGCYQQIECTAWITLCSHVFCAEHGRELRQRLTANPGSPCPACGSIFRDGQSLLERKLDHPVQVRALQLCGYNPEVIMEIATVAIAFWNHQKLQVCANLTRKNEFYKESALVARKERDDAEEQLRRVKVQLGQVQAENHELKEKIVATKRNRRRDSSERDHKKLGIEKQRRQEDDFLL
ncbi:E3 ubiquitin-protein ligase CCNB1IP1-like [Culex pipiens pallens]|uniref:E3 ubiquitin-protein ligase CCNB1IP1-like n=1 Tax=Culex pipiens pallens TaxID=42434 RepID=UPI001953D8BD|nr:E3 ubiquitin-protein ligase CCNB1IP1-like [Culex pipiens pallens]XP_052562496.1 E3 ubiquitin-protein ligase CCNB1IP1-like [Culex pipiens pallens]